MAITLQVTSTVAEAVAAVAKGDLTKDQLLDWLNVTAIDMGDAVDLMQVIDKDAYRAVMVRQGQLIAEAEARKAKAQSGNGVLSIKLGEKGGMTLRGLKGIPPRFGMTLYGHTLLAILAESNAKTLLAFVRDNRKAMSWGKDLKAGEQCPDADIDAACKRFGV